MNNVNNLNSYFKEMYSDSLEDLMSNFHWDKEESKLYYNEVRMLGFGLSVMLGITPAKPKILVLELTNG